MSKKVGIITHIRTSWRVFGAVVILCYMVAMLHIESIIKGYTKERGFNYRRKLISAYMWLLNLECTYEGSPIDEPALYVSNHRMMIDPVILLRHCNAFIVSKAEVDSYPVLGSGARNAGVIFVQRDHRGSRAAIRQKIEELLIDGNSVAIFPEGTVNLKPTTASFAPGSFDAAIKSNRPVVPVALDYEDTSVYWGANTSLLRHFINVFRLKKVVCKVHFLPPIYGDDALNTCHLAQDAIDAALLSFRNEWNKKR